MLAPQPARRRRYMLSKIFGCPDQLLLYFQDSNLQRADSHAEEVYFRIAFKYLGEKRWSGTLDIDFPKRERV